MWSFLPRTRPGICLQAAFCASPGRGRSREEEEEGLQPSCRTWPWAMTKWDTELPSAQPVHRGQSHGRSPVNPAEVLRLQISRVITVLLILWGSAVPGAVSQSCNPSCGPQTGSPEAQTSVCACACVCMCVSKGRPLPCAVLLLIKEFNVQDELGVGIQVKRDSGPTSRPCGL